MARWRRKRKKRLTPGLSSLRVRLPGRRAPGPAAAPVAVDYTPQIQRVTNATLALGNRVDVLLKKALPTPKDYGPDVQRLDDAVLALGDRVDQMGRWR